MNWRCFLTAGVLLVACKDDAPVDAWTNFVPFVAVYYTYGLPYNSGFASPGDSVGVVTLDELSGLAASRVNTNSLWAQNDSGGANAIYLLDVTSARIKASYQLNGMVNIDWEDIECGPGPEAGTSYVYLGDIGDNDANRTSITVYRFPEPLYNEVLDGLVISLQPVFDALTLKYPDGSHNAETLLVDPSTKDIYIVTKYGANSCLYVARYPQKADATNVLEKVGAFPFREATGGDVSALGNEVTIKTYDQIFYWKRHAGEPFWEMLSRDPERLPYNPVEIKGEAITWWNGDYFTISEKSNDIPPVLYHYKHIANE